MSEQFTNFAQSILVSSILDTSGQIELTDGINFPSADFYITIDGDTNTPEIIFIQSRTDNSLIAMHRGQKGTLAQPHAAGAKVIHTILAHHITSLFNEPKPGEPLLDGDLDDGFDIDTLSPNWLEVHTNANPVSIAQGKSRFSIHKSTTAADASGQAAHTYLRPLGGLTFPQSIETGLRFARPYAVNYQMFGLILTDGTSTTSNCVWMMAYGNNTLGSAWVFGFRSGTLSSINANVDLGNYEAPGSAPLYQRLRWTGVNTFVGGYSSDGVQWLESATMSYGLAPTHYGVAMGTWGGSYRMLGSADYIKVSNE